MANFGQCMVGSFAGAAGS